MGELLITRTGMSHWHRLRKPWRASQESVHHTLCGKEIEDEGCRVYVMGQLDMPKCKRCEELYRQQCGTTPV